MKTLASYIQGAWVEGTGSPATLVNPSTAEPIAQASTAGIDFAAALDYGRTRGGPALRELTFAQRGELLKQLSKLVYEAREELIALAIENGGNTRGDAKFDIDGASATFAAYAELGAELGDARILIDGDGIQLGRSPRFHGQHVRTSKLGIAVHINAFNFPAWGLAEKAACALLAGVPVISKPATATALVTHRLTELIAEAKTLPEGALQLVCGSAGDLLSHLRGQDTVAFTGSSDTAAMLRAQTPIVRDSVHINVEADSLNAAVLGPDVGAGSDTEDMFVADVARDMTQKTGQKCTAIRRVYVPVDRADDIIERVRERLGDVRVGNPAEQGIKMGPVATESQLRDVRAGIERLTAATTEAYTGDAPDGPGYFVPATLRRTDDPAACAPLNEHEVFGPVSTIATYDGDPNTAAALVRLGAGGLVSSVYSDDRDFLKTYVPAIASHHGRVFIGSKKVAGHSPGPGTVLPQLVHGGPGRAGGGEELGGVAGLRLYMQRTALQGDKGIITKLW